MSVSFIDESEYWQAIESEIARLRTENEQLQAEAARLRDKLVTVEALSRYGSPNGLNLQSINRVAKEALAAVRGETTKEAA